MPIDADDLADELLCEEHSVAGWPIAQQWPPRSERMNMDDEPKQDALFYIEGPDERGCVWMHGVSSRDRWAQNLGPRDKVAEALSQWLGSIDSDEAENG
jgi:hypothetical protein